MSTVQGKLVEERIVQPGHHASGKVRQGQVLRIIDVEGQQVADFVSFRLDDPTEHCDCIYSNVVAGRWKLTKGDVLVTNHCRPLWTIVEDTCGEHYSGGGFCSRDLNSHPVVGAVGQKGCRDCLSEAIAEHGLSPLYLDTASCFNIFMHIGYDPDGTWEIRLPKSRADGHIDLRAEMDVLWAVSCCIFPGPCNGDHPTPLKFELYDPR